MPLKNKISFINVINIRIVDRQKDSLRLFNALLSGNRLNTKGKTWEITAYKQE